MSCNRKPELTNITLPSGASQWRSLDEHNRTPEYREHLQEEFAPNTDLFPADENSRRRFLQIMAASFAMGGAVSCRQPVEKIVPYVRPPEQIIPGKPLWFATAILENGLAQGVLVESHMGRPSKVEGNPQHPASLGATGVVSQAAILSLYDPDRSRSVRGPDGFVSWGEMQMSLRRHLRRFQGRGGAGLRLLTETVTSPTLAAQIRQLLQMFPQAVWHQYEPAGAHSARLASMASFGRPVNTYYRLDRANVILALDSDFLACGPSSTRYAHDFAQRRKVRGGQTGMSRFYALESTFSPTGGKADHRWPLASWRLEQAAGQIASALGVPGAAPGADVLRAGIVASLVQDLTANRGSAVVIPGETQTAAVHSLAHAMNAFLGAPGATVIHTDPVEAQSVDQVRSLEDLVAAMNSGEVELLLMIGGNPVFNAPADIPFTDSLRRVPNKLHLSLYEDETSAVCNWHVPRAHSLETWSDARAFDGTVTVLQPLIAPLYDGHSDHELMAAVLGENLSSYDIVRNYWRAQAGSAGFEGWWRKTVHDGLVENSAAPPVQVKAGAPAAPMRRPGPELEITFRPDPYILDGSLANNAWLQELPRPLSKLTWDNALYVSPATAQSLNLETRDLVEISANGRKLEIPVWVLPGQPDHSLAVHLGFGRKRAGNVGSNVGFNAYAIRTVNGLWRSGVSLHKTERRYPLASTQIHFSSSDRPLALSGTLAEYRADPDFAVTQTHPPEYEDTLYPHSAPAEYAWGMAIDLTACVNCNACVIACQSENNIAVVGKTQVLANRQMHWLRVDTYFEGDPRNPEVHYQPLPCMQCEYAPCELVCPTHATVHSSDGLNDMVYNRCIGTRYCSNNCPYKVRRFNFLDYTDRHEPIQLMRNPDVTVRSRGVMEKCTYCVQRIREAEIEARKEDRKIRDGEVQTACQQVCPAQAIVFGNIGDPNSQVSRWKKERRNYSLLAELNTRPRTTYLARITNPNGQIKAQS